MNKGKALRFAGGFLMMFGLFGLFVPDGHIQLNMMSLAVGSAFSIFGMTA